MCCVGRSVQCTAGAGGVRSVPRGRGECGVYRKGRGSVPEECCHITHRDTQVRHGLGECAVYRGGWGSVECTHGMSVQSSQ